MVTVLGVPVDAVAHASSVAVAVAVAREVLVLPGAAERRALGRRVLFPFISDASVLVILVMIYYVFWAPRGEVLSQYRGRRFQESRDEIDQMLPGRKFF